MDISYQEDEQSLIVAYRFICGDLEAGIKYGMSEEMQADHATKFSRLLGRPIQVPNNGDSHQHAEWMWKLFKELKEARNG